jgi:16S rRNA (guanine966-N2)-methyltransferase
MRITGGEAKGIPIKAPKGRRTRPTSDKVREGVFQTLGDSVLGARVLDLFAGSGALGIEALSRGADFCCFVEKSPMAAEVISQNLQKTHFHQKTETIRSDFRTALKILHRRGQLFHLVFVDPPYEGDFLELVTASFEAYPVFAQGAVLVVEHFKKTSPPARMAGLTQKKTRLYGQTSITYYLKD